MKQQFLKFVLGGLAAAMTLQAGSVKTCQTDTLAHYLSMEGACSVGLLDFSDFSFSASSTGEAILKTANDIQITPVLQGHGGGFDIGLENPNNLPIPPFFSVGAGQSANYVLGWYFFIDPSPVGAGADLGVDPPFGDVRITQQYCVDSQFSFAGSQVSCTNGTGDAPPVQSLFVTVENPTAHIDFNPPAKIDANVRTIISLNGTTQSGASGFDGATGKTDIVTSSTPEPVSITLIFAGLLAMAASRKLRPAS